MNKIFNIVYLISNSSVQTNKIKKAKELENIVKEEYDMYQQLSNLIIDEILQKNFTPNSTLKNELLIYNNSIINLKNKIFNIYIDEILKMREITEIDELKILNKELYDLLTTYDDNNFIIVIDYKLIKFIKSLIKKEKIYKKIYFITDFNKPILYMIKEFYSILT